MWRVPPPWPDLPPAWANPYQPWWRRPVTFERTATGWVLGLGGGRIEIVETDEEPLRVPDNVRDSRAVRVFAASAEDGRRALEFLVERHEKVFPRPPVQAPLPRCRGTMALVRERLAERGARFRAWMLIVAAHDEWPMMMIWQRGDEPDAFLELERPLSSGIRILLRDGWPDRTPENDPNLASARAVFEEWRPVTLPGMPFGDAPDGRLWTESRRGERTVISTGPCGGPYELVEMDGACGGGRVLADGRAALVIFDPGEGSDEWMPIDLVRVDAGTGVRWSTRVGYGSERHFYDYVCFVDPSGRYAVTQVDAFVKVLRLRDGVVVLARDSGALELRGWTDEGILLSNDAGRARIWRPGERIRHAICRGQFVSPSGRFRLDYDANEDRMDVWEASGARYVIRGVRGPWPGLRYWPGGWLADDLVWMGVDGSDSVLVSLPSGAMHLMAPNAFEKPEIHFATPRMAFSHKGHDNWLVSSARVDPTSPLAR